MSDEAPKVGARIRALRSERDLSLRGLADQSGVSANAISRIERGESSPTVSSLHRLARALGVHITQLFDAGPERATVVMRSQERPRSRVEGVVVESLGTGLRGQRLGPFLMTLMPGTSAGGQAVSHPGEEFAYCVEGEVEYRVGEEWYRLSPGDSLLFRATQPHAWRNPGTEQAVLLLVIQTSDEDVGVTQQQHLMTGTSEPSDAPEPGGHDEGQLSPGDA